MDRFDGNQVECWDSYVGARCLVAENRPNGYCGEVTVIEVSPSGNRVKFRFPYNSEVWETGKHYLLVEALSK